MRNQIKPEQVGLKSRYIKLYIDKLEEAGFSTHSLLLARGEQIFFEGYWEPFHADYGHRMYSVTKSIVSLAIGFLEQEGRICLDDYIGKYFPEEIQLSVDENVKRQTIRHMLIMNTAGLPDYNGFWFHAKSEDRVKYYFERKGENSRSPGTVFEYDSTGSFVLGALVERVTGMEFMEYLRERLLDPIGVSKEAYCMKCPGGHAWGDSGLVCTARDLFKIVRFVRNKGNCQGKQLLNEKYITDALENQSDVGVRRNEKGFFGYGYQIWKSWQDSFVFNGMGCQMAVGVPGKDLILIITSDNQGNDFSYRMILEYFFDIIVANLKEEPVTDDGDYEILMSETEKLKLAAAKGAKSSNLEEEIHGVTYKMKENPMGITSMRFMFHERGGVLTYVNAQGKKELPFGRCENVFCDFPEEGYADLTGGISVPGHKYHCAASGAWVMENRLYLNVQIIDRYFGRLHIYVGFSGKQIGVQMIKSAEDFLDTYEGFAKGERL